jgi:cobalt-zinc-cadmium efflux system membrane fusion protein
MQAITESEAVPTVESSANGEANAQPPPQHTTPKKFPTRTVAVAILSIAALAAAAVFLLNRTASRSATAAETIAPDASPRGEGNLVTVDEQQMPSITLEPVSGRAFLAEKTATGKIGFNEDVMTPVFSPYAGRVVGLLAKPGDFVRRGSALLEIDTPDLVQAEQDLIAASLGVAKEKTVLDLATRAEDRQHRLYLNKAAALKDWEQAEADVKNAQRDLHSAENALAAARSRLRMFGKTDEEISKIETERQIDRIARVGSPIAGTIVARKVGPGQYAKPDSVDPLFTIADLSTVWLLADVYESDVPLIRVGQPVEVHVAAFPNESFSARITYIGASVDPATRRVAVRSVVENRRHKLKPEMFASFRVVTDSQIQSLAVPAGAIVHEGGKTCVWVKQSTNQFARREVTVGLEQQGWVQVISGLQAGDQVVSQGSIFISNLASS